MGIAATVPKVPGAIGASPEPKPKAKKCTGLLILGRFNSILFLAGSVLAVSLDYMLFSV
jgi:hypothetical protein